MEKSYARSMCELGTSVDEPPSLSYIGIAKSRPFFGTRTALFGQPVGGERVNERRPLPLSLILDIAP